MMIEPPFAILAVFIVLTVVGIAIRLLKLHFPMDSYVPYMWGFFLLFTLAQFVDFSIAIWTLAFVCFAVLREYISLLSIRLQDRLIIWGAYLSIPFMTYCIQIDWYGMFIVSVPVYAYLLMAFLATLGGNEREGTVHSIGAIYFGTFLFVYCLGHLGYLTAISIGLAVTLVVNVFLCDAIAYFVGTRMKFTLLKTIGSIPVTMAVTLLLSQYFGVPATHALVMGAMTPPLVAMSRRTIMFVETDLHIDRDNLRPGYGQVIDNLKSYLFAAPIVFHYVRHFIA